MARKRSSNKKNKNIANAEIRVRSLPLELRNEISAESYIELFGVTIDGEFLKTPGETLVIHEDERAIRELAAELEYSDELDATKISLYGLLSTKIEFVDKNRQDFSIEFLTHSLLNDPVFKPCAGPEVIEQLQYLSMVIDYLEGNNLKYPNLPQFHLEVDYLEEKPVNQEFNNNFRSLVAFVQNTIHQLNNYQMSVFLTVAHVFKSPILAIMLAKKIISPNEFAVIFLTTLAINSKIWSETDREEERVLLGTYTRQAECMIRYMDQFSPKLTDVEKIIREGESKTVEFKSTLRWNIRAKQNDEKIEYEVLKTIVAFLNTDGGILLVGVEDNGNVLGTELDGFSNEDKYLLYFKDLIVTKIGREYFDIIKFGLELAKLKKVLLIECKRSSKPAFVKYDGKEDFYVRTGPSSAKLSPSDMLEYAKTRFHSQ